MEMLRYAFWCIWKQKFCYLLNFFEKSGGAKTYFCPPRCEKWGGTCPLAPPLPTPVLIWMIVLGLNTRISCFLTLTLYEIKPSYPLYPLFTITTCTILNYLTICTEKVCHVKIFHTPRGPSGFPTSQPFRYATDWYTINN